MRRLYSLVLLVALISTPLTAVGAALFSNSGSCCCCGTMCPMHMRSQQEKQRGKLCGGDLVPMRQCCSGMSGCNQQSDLGVLASSSQAILDFSVSVSVPQRTQELASAFSVSEPYRTIIPPKQPPRL